MQFSILLISKAPIPHVRHAMRSQRWASHSAISIAFRRDDKVYYLERLCLSSIAIASHVAYVEYILNTLISNTLKQLNDNDMYNIKRRKHPAQKRKRQINEKRLRCSSKTQGSLYKSEHLHPQMTNEHSYAQNNCYTATLKKNKK